MAFNSKYNKQLDDDKKPLSGKERYEAYLEKERKINEMLEGNSEEDMSEIDMSKLSASERYAVYKNKEAQAKKQEEEPPAEPETVEEIPEEKEEIAEVIPEENSTVEEAADGGEAAPEEVENKNEPIPQRQRGGTADDDMEKRAFIRRIIFSAVFAGVAIALQLITFHVPFTPRTFTIDFSALPELFAAITYGPITGIVIVIVKNIAYMLINHNAVATAVSNIILDTIFVTLSSLLYTKRVFMKTKKSNKPLNRNQIKMRVNFSRIVNAFGGGLCGGLLTTIVSFFVINYITFPIIFRRYPKEEFSASLIDQYQRCIDGITGYIPFLADKSIEVHSIMQGTLLVNVEITFLKYALVTVLTALIYPFVSDFLHYRK